MNKEMEHLNHTTHHISPPNNKPEFPGYYALIPFVLLTLTGCIVAAVCYIRRRVRLDELRHQLIPMYTYDPAEEQDDWGNAGRDNEEELTEPLYKDAQLSFTTDYGT
ncbi:small integral membrane protein 29-like [Amphiprion ocellaris]|uniref:small integral membrane protein 29-like n=1 Tax=Amphiprion ocellaris TaxID=80972 RepID=UPI0024115ED3|nr:small integral membrane protein 29-like [Amphiprion ocellaris]XP_035807614.2 small integral membrane protein 29-like [Amphiprion ocellaris]